MLSEKYGVTISAMATGRIYSVDGCSMASSDEQNRQTCVERLCDLADFSVSIGRPAIVIGAVRGRYADASSENAYYQQFDKSLRSLVEYCEKIDVPVILEVIERAESEAYTDPAETLRYVENPHSPCLHMYLDTMRLYNEGIDIAEAIRMYGPHSWQIDISGENRTSPMNSAIDFSKVAEAIRTSGFQGTLAFEMPPYPPEGSARKSLEYIRRLVEQASPKALTIFHQQTCPFCIKARQALDELLDETPAYRSVPVEWIEESEHPEIIERYDYYATPSIFMGEEKLYEATIFDSFEKIKENVRNALNLSLKNGNP